MSNAAKCKCGASQIAFKHLKFEDMDGKWECPACNKGPSPEEIEAEKAKAIAEKEAKEAKAAQKKAEKEAKEAKAAQKAAEKAQKAAEKAKTK